jgi:hypothetical protein
MADDTLPGQFADLEPWAEDWALPTRQQRYGKRLSATITELGAFYDAVAPRAEDAITYLNGRDITSLAGADLRLLRLLQALILVSYAVNVFDQPRIPDSGAAFFDTLVEPAI